MVQIVKVLRSGAKISVKEGGRVKTYSYGKTKPKVTTITPTSRSPSIPSSSKNAVSRKEGRPVPPPSQPKPQTKKRTVITTAAEIAAQRGERLTPESARAIEQQLAKEGWQKQGRYYQKTITSSEVSQKEYYVSDPKTGKQMKVSKAMYEKIQRDQATQKEAERRSKLGRVVSGEKFRQEKKEQTIKAIMKGKGPLAPAERWLAAKAGDPLRIHEKVVKPISKLEEEADIRKAESQKAYLRFQKGEGSYSPYLKLKAKQFVSEAKVGASKVITAPIEVGGTILAFEALPSVPGGAAVSKIAEPIFTTTIVGSAVSDKQDPVRSLGRTTGEVAIFLGAIESTRIAKKTGIKTKPISAIKSRVETITTPEGSAMQKSTARRVYKVGKKTAVVDSKAIIEFKKGESDLMVSHKDVLYGKGRVDLKVTYDISAKKPKVERGRSKIDTSVSKIDDSFKSVSQFDITIGDTSKKYGTVSYFEPIIIEESGLKTYRSMTGIRRLPKGELKEISTGLTKEMSKEVVRRPKIVKEGDKTIITEVPIEITKSQSVKIGVSDKKLWPEYKLETRDIKPGRLPETTYDFRTQIPEAPKLPKQSTPPKRTARADPFTERSLTESRRTKTRGRTRQRTKEPKLEPLQISQSDLALELAEPAIKAKLKAELAPKTETLIIPSISKERQALKTEKLTKQKIRLNTVQTTELFRAPKIELLTKPKTEQIFDTKMETATEIVPKMTPDTKTSTKLITTPPRINNIFNELPKQPSMPPFFIIPKLPSLRPIPEYKKRGKPRKQPKKYYPSITASEFRIKAPKKGAKIRGLSGLELRPILG